MWAGRSGTDSNEEAKKVGASAPVVLGWTIRLYKPPKEWNITFSVSLDGKQVAIDGSQLPPNLENVDDEKLWTVALTIVDGELGEEVRRACVSRVDVTSTWSVREAPMARRLAPGLLREMVVDQS